MAARASESDGEIALALPNVVRQQIDEQIGDLFDELAGLRKRADVASDGGILPGELLELRNGIGVGQEANVEDEIAIRRQAVTEPEAGDVDQDLRRLAFAGELLANEIAQLVDVELRCVDGDLGQSPN